MTDNVSLKSAPVMEPDGHLAFPFLRRRMALVRCAVAGVGYLARTQVHARVHALCTAGVIVAGFAGRLRGDEWCWLVLAMGTVWTAEGFNTALELLADAVHPDHHPLVGRAKDVAAGAVLLASVTAAIIGGIIFLPHLLSW